MRRNALSKGKILNNYNVIAENLEGRGGYEIIIILVGYRSGSLSQA